MCSLRQDAQIGNNRFLDAIERCCKPSRVNSFQCWNYCAVQESIFPKWFGCIQETLNSTWGASCQRADQSPLLTATGPPPPSYTQPQPPLDYSYSLFTPVTSSSAVLKARDSTATHSTSSTVPLATDVQNATKPTPSASPTDAKKSRSAKTLEFSMTGIVCALLILSTLTV